ncbi:hypothetical protein OAO55_03690, partial [Bacteroidales bacterium]|nr:hypothetical protein [Bacteroidales bacterium]
MTNNVSKKILSIIILCVVTITNAYMQAGMFNITMVPYSSTVSNETSAQLSDGKILYILKGSNKQAEGKLMQIEKKNNKFTKPKSVLAKSFNEFNIQHASVSPMGTLMCFEHFTGNNSTLFFIENKNGK